MSNTGVGLSMDCEVKGQFAVTATDVRPGRGCLIVTFTAGVSKSEARDI
jgi:hypothetical protein